MTDRKRKSTVHLPGVERVRDLALKFRQLGGRNAELAALSIITNEESTSMLERWVYALRVTKLGPSELYEAFTYIGMRD